ncbi:hypothetical protein BASA60_002529 [Batrachochytrium salamandrivorans]|nr:hypothetical protein BASA60_002529 [Batrachochytrium salamandrivorans]
MAPYSCFHATTGVTFTFIEGDADITKKPTVVVTSTAKHPELLAPLWGGLLQDPNSIDFQFKSHFNPGIIYTVNVPYVSGHDEECWNLGSKLYKSLPSITLPGTPETSLPVSAEQPGHSQESDIAHLSPEGHKMDSPEDPEREAAIEKRSSSEQKSVPESANMGIIKLDSFMPEDIETKSLAVLKAVMIVRSLLANELKDTQLGHLRATWKLRCWCHPAIRTGRYNGQGIEDVGIEPDTVFRPQWSDLQPNSPTNTQYDRIAESLARTGQENGQSKLHFVCEPFEIEKPPWQILIGMSAAGSALGNNRITIVGKTAGTQVLKTIRNVRIIPTNDKYMKISTREFIFEGISDSVGLYQSPTTAPADGWNNLKGQWMIGNGIKYAKNIDSFLEAFFTAPVGTKINIGLNAVFDTVPGCDFLYLSVKSSGGVEDFLIRSKSHDGKKTFNGISGREKIVRKTIPFTTKSKRFSVSLRFTSDKAVELTGATIKLVHCVCCGTT